jgi:indole-3-glycerol phosphate synthase
MILETIAAATRTRVARAKLERPLEELREAAAETRTTTCFEEALSRPEISFICELKKASPSKGVIAHDFPYLSIARDYAEAGAAALSVLTEPDFFQGDNAYLRDITQAVPLPALRKDFIIDEYQIYEARVLGASAILLICALLETATLERYLGIANTLGLACLVETHNEAELASALAAGARIIGINNRDLKTFQVDLETTARLRPLVPPDKLVVSESGIQSRREVAALQEQGVDAALIGEALMRASDKKQYLAQLRGNAL